MVNRILLKNFLLGSASMIVFCASMALAADIYTCPKNLSCNIQNLNSPACELPSGWNFGSYSYTGNPQTNTVTFSSAQSYSWGAYCNYYWGSQSQYYAVTIYNTTYYAASSGGIWQPSKDAAGILYYYCYSKSNNSFQANDPSQCPVQTLTAWK